MKRLPLLAALLVTLPLWVPRIWAQSTARQAGYLYLSPVPGAPYVSAQTRYILVRLAQTIPSAITNLTTGFISVSGAQSGAHTGTTRLATDGKTVIFTTGTDFASNELVNVALNPLVAKAASGLVQPFQYQFSVTAPMPGTVTPPVHPAVGPSKAPLVAQTARAQLQVIGPPPKAKAVAQAIVMPNGVSVPSDFPQVVITVNSNPSPGSLFLENGLSGVPPYTMILNNDGLPVWYRRGRMYDFKIQKNGMITWCLSDDTGFPAFDQNFRYLKTYLTTNGYSSDGHELKVQADGSYYMIGYRNNPVDLSQYVEGGDPNATVRETVVQGFTPAGELVFQWRAWDNYDIRDCIYTSDFAHLNAIDIDADGNVLVSARHLSEVTKINRASGEIMWRLSGAHSSFQFVNDPLGGTTMQHNISALGQDHYMVFDNGDLHTPEVSRAAEYQLDLTNLTATLAWQFRDQPDKYAWYLGNAQRLPSGNTLINFVLAQYPKVIEVDPGGAKHFELSLVPGSDAYRAFRLPWNGVVATPNLIVEPQPDNITLVFNKFGDTNVAYYRIYGGTSPAPTTLLAESATTLKSLSNLPNGQYFFRVTALSRDGSESAFSNEESVNVNIIQPGRNLVQNGDFSQGTNGWSFEALGAASATWVIEDGASQFYITNGGVTTASIQLGQTGLTLIQGKQYVLEFDAWSAEPRYIEIKVTQSNYPFSDYSQISPPFLTPDPTHYRFVFTMQRSTDFSANLLFNLGTSSATVYLQNIALFTPPVGDLNQDGRVDALDLSLLSSQWLQQQPGLPADLNGDGKVDFTDFSLFGENWTSGQQ